MTQNLDNMRVLLAIQEGFDCTGLRFDVFHSNSASETNEFPGKALKFRATILRAYLFGHLIVHLSVSKAKYSVIPREPLRNHLHESCVYA